MPVPVLRKLAVQDVPAIPAVPHYTALLPRMAGTLDCINCFKQFQHKILMFYLFGFCCLTLFSRLFLDSTNSVSYGLYYSLVLFCFAYVS